MSDEPDEYAVGYGRPPRHAQFKKGRSGNPKGRPKKTLPSLRTEELRGTFNRMLHHPVRIKEGATERTVPAYEAILLRLIQKAAAGDNASLRMFLELLRNLTESDGQGDTYAEAARRVHEKAKKLLAADGNDDQ